MMAGCKSGDDTKTIILKSEDRDLTVAEVGDGSNFYCEPISIGGDEYYIHHSTMGCPRIKNGVQRNCYKLDGYNNIFCPGCMSDWLISAWKDRFFPNGYKSN
jgi:hypothetical protein